MSSRGVIRSLLRVLGLFLIFAAAASAETLTLSQTFSGNVTKTGANPLIHIPLTFSQFDGSLGTLTAASLAVDLSGGATLDSSTCFAPDKSYCFAQGSFNASAPGNSASQNYNLSSNNPTAVFSFLLKNPSSLALTGLTGNGTVTVGNFDLGITLAQGLFPNAATGNVNGTVTLTYTYDQNPGTAPEVPEPASITLLISGAAVALRRLRKVAD